MLEPSRAEPDEDAAVSPSYGVVAVVLVSVATLSIGAYGWRFSRTTSDFFVASRSVRPALNASAIGGEYLSAASFLGVAGLVLAFGAEMLWYPVGWTAGYFVLLVLVAAPLRRSGAYTLSDFAESRLESPTVRKVSAVLVVAVGWLYLMPQFDGAGLSLGTVADTPPWAGRRARRGRRARQRALRRDAQHHVRAGLPVLAQAHRAARPGDVPARGLGGRRRHQPDGDRGRGDRRRGSGRTRRSRASTGSTRRTPSSSATFLGTMGLPHVVVRFYTNPDGRAARRTTLVVLALLGVFYVLPPVYGALGRLYAPDLVATGQTDTVVLELPSRMVDGVVGHAAVVADGGRCLRGLPLDVERADDRGGRRAEPGRARAQRLGPAARRGAHASRSARSSPSRCRWC